MADGIGKRRLLTPEYLIGQNAVLFKRAAQKIFSHVIGVHLHFRVNAHDIADKIKIAERYTRFQRVYGNAAVSTQNVVHVQLVHSLFSLALELLRRGGKVGVLIAEQLIGNLAREQHAHIGFLMYRLAAKVHAHARADGGYIIGPQHRYDFLERGNDLVARHGDLHVLRADEIGDLARIFKIDGVLIHADGKGADLFAQKLCRYCAHKA